MEIILATEQANNEVRSFCRQCGGSRFHNALAEETRYWESDEGCVSGEDTWSILECAGCHTISFVHRHWFSEDTEITDDGPTPVVHIHNYPPAPVRKRPEWGINLFMGLPMGTVWFGQLHDDIYSAMGIKAYSLAAMGIRALLDYLVTSQVGGTGNFKDKLNEMCKKNLITSVQVDVIYAAFDTGSAAAHRGYSPPEEDVNTLLNVTEALIHKIYVLPVEQDNHAKAATAMKTRTPVRQVAKGKSP